MNLNNQTLISNTEKKVNRKKCELNFRKDDQMKEFL